MKEYKVRVPSKEIFSFYTIVWCLLTLGIILFSRFSFLSFLIFWILIPVLFLTTLLREGGLKFRNKGLNLYIWFVGWGGFSVIYAINKGYALDNLKVMLGNIVVWYIAFTCILHIKSIKLLAYPLLIAFFLHLVFQFVIPTKITVTSEGLTRTAGLLANPNALGFLLWYGIVISALLLYHHDSKLWKLICIIAIVLFIFGIFNTGSRKNLFAVLLFFGIFAFLQGKKKNYFLLFILMIVGYITYSLIYDYVMMNTIVGVRLQAGSLESGADTRADLILEAWNTFLKYPLLGVGLGNFQLYSSTNHVAHNDYLEILADLGIFAFIIYISIYINYFKLLKITLIKNSRKLLKGHLNIAIIGASFFAGYVFLGMARPTFLDPIALLMFAFFQGLLIKIYHSYKIQEKQTAEESTITS